jgi:hypothetical protein
MLFHIAYLVVDIDTDGGSHVSRPPTRNLTPTTATQCDTGNLSEEIDTDAETLDRRMPLGSIM